MRKLHIYAPMRSDSSIRKLDRPVFQLSRIKSLFTVFFGKKLFYFENKIDTLFSEYDLKFCFRTSEKIINISHFTLKL